MSPGLKTKRKQILSDPVAMFSVLHPDAEEKTITLLATLSQEIQSLKKLREKSQVQTKSISRKIGEAKRNGEPINEFKASMREHSIHLRAINNELDDAENRILSFFEPENEEVSSKATLGEEPAAQIHTPVIKNIDDIYVSLLDDEQNEWNTYVSKNPAATIHHLAEWRELMQKTYGHECFYFLARNNDGHIVGILPLIRLKSRLFGDFLVSMPYFQRGGAVADHPGIGQKLMHAANDRAATLGIDHIEYRDDIPRETLTARTEKVNMVLSLPDSPEELWGGFTSKLRAQIKRPQREEPQILLGGEEYLDDFYRVYARNMRDLGSMPHSKQLIRNILEVFPEYSWIIVLYMNQRPVAAGFLLGHGNTLEIPLASTIRDVNPLSMNMLLYWEVLRFAINHGFRNFDFGRSSKGAGTFRFKQQWGAQPKQLYWHYWLGKAGELPSLNPSNPKYALAISLWKRLPVALANWLGPLIVRNLP